MIRPPDYLEDDDRDYINYGDDDDYWSEYDECRAAGGTTCRYAACPEWRGDGLCLAELRSGYGMAWRKK